MNDRRLAASCAWRPRASDFGSAIDVRIVGVIEPALEPRLEADGPPAAKVYLPSPIGPEPALALYVRTRGTAAMLARRSANWSAGSRRASRSSSSARSRSINERSYGPQLWLAPGGRGPWRRRASACHRGPLRCLVLRRRDAVARDRDPHGDRRQAAGDPGHGPRPVDAGGLSGCWSAAPPRSSSAG